MHGGGAGPPRAVEPSLVALHGIDTGNISERYFTSSFRL